MICLNSPINTIQLSVIAGDITNVFTDQADLDSVQEIKKILESESQEDVSSVRGTSLNTNFVV